MPVVKTAPQKRAYRMGARARATEQTAHSIKAAAIALFRELPFELVTLEAIAARAGVTLQTVLRRFGSKQALFEEAARSLADATVESRVPERAGDVRLAVTTLLASYEAMGDIAWRALCQEEQFEFLHVVLDDARAKHRAWIEACFAFALDTARGPERERRALLLFSATDYYLYKLLRRDLGKSEAETLNTMVDLVSATLLSFESKGHSVKS